MCGSVERVTVGAALAIEQAAAALGVGRPIEKPERVEVGEQVGYWFFADRLNSEALIRHSGPHRGSMIPHASRDAGRRVLTLQAFREVGTSRAAAAVDAMATDARERLEPLGTTL